VTDSTPARLAEHIRAKLAEELQTLELLERELKSDQDLHERVRGDAIAVAIDHVRQAMDALELASKN
jgi:Holliday junction resolvasome RuvABC endonuclease subunit